MNLVLIILSILMALAGIVSGGSGTPGVASGGPGIIPVSVATAAPVADATPTPPAGPAPFDVIGSGPSH